MLSVESIKAVCDGSAAIFALGAAIVWFMASFAPVGSGGPSPYMPYDLNDPLWKAIRANGERILRGARLNRYAAFLTGLSAFAMFLSWLLPWFLT
jgi:hypothetical protein